MSDSATLPPPHSSSGELPLESGSRSESSSSEGDFTSRREESSLPDSKIEDSNNADSRADNKQKRKRTSPADQAILESEYKQNPKPNKAARADIVAKVSLSEKEVQIWFQNRRQINRRKSRPLLPHEIAAFGLGGMAALSSDPAAASLFSSSDNMRPASQPSSQEDIEAFQDITATYQAPDAQEIETELDTAKSTIVSELQQPFVPSLKRQSSSSISMNHNASESTSESVAKSFTSTPGYLANRWNPSNSFSTPSSSLPPFSVTPPISNPVHPTSCPERIDPGVTAPASKVRLSLSLDGKAELISSSPSPPRPSTAHQIASSAYIRPRKRMEGLQRSHSALPFTLPSIQSMAPLMPRLPTGRSRDARSWEFCCDIDARDELTTQAENESSGSAVAAISLLRSASNSILKPNTNKRNAPPKNDSTKHSKKPKLGRAMSSLARLQNPLKPNQDSLDYNKPGLLHSPSGDSDKENWMPHENGSNLRRRPMHSSRTDRDPGTKILGDNLHIPTHAYDLDGSKSRKRKTANAETEIFEDHDAVKVGPEVEKFMRGEVSPSKKGDLDCIHGLLSLSQGNWR